MEHIERHGTGPYCVAWQLGRLVERDLLALLELGRQTTDLPFRLILHPGKTQFDRKIEWEDRSSGRRYRYLKDRWLEKKASSNKDLEAMRAAVAQSRILVWDLSTRLEVLRNAESRLTEALLEANELLGQCSRVEKVPRVWGY